jgi:hypothetical protein
MIDQRISRKLLKMSSKLHLKFLKSHPPNINRLRLDDTAVGICKYNWTICYFMICQLKETLKNVRFSLYYRSIADTQQGS